MGVPCPGPGKGGRGGITMFWSWLENRVRWDGRYSVLVLVKRAGGGGICSGPGWEEWWVGVKVPCPGPGQEGRGWGYLFWSWSGGGGRAGWYPGPG